MKNQLFPVILIFALLMVPMSVSCNVEAASSFEEQKTITITNVYSSSFISKGIIPEYEHSEGGIMFFIEDSPRHRLMLGFLGGEVDSIDGDDISQIKEGSFIRAYFLDTKDYERWNTTIEFNDADGYFKDYINLQFTSIKSVDTFPFFFTDDSVAEISWNSENTAVRAYFNGDQVGHDDVKDIGRNGAYVMKFVDESNDGKTLYATVTYSISGYQKSSSVSIGLSLWIISIGIVGILLLAKLPPKWTNGLNGDGK